MELKRILMPTDFSENADHAFQYALAFARAFGAKLYIMHVVHFPPQIQLYVTRDVLDRLVKDVETSLKELIERSKETKINFNPVVRLGVEDSEITGLAEKERIHLIVMGTHGRTGLAHTFLGSVAERVVRHAPCPVLTVKLPSTKGRKAVKQK